MKPWNLWRGSSVCLTLITYVFFYHILFMQSLITFYSFITSLRVLESLSMFSPSFCLAHCFRLHNSVFYITGTERKSHLKWGLDTWRWDNIFFFPKSLYKLKFYLPNKLHYIHKTNTLSLEKSGLSCT